MLYVIDDAGRPCRVGFALGNEFSDHVLERQNYLYLAHSKLRPCACGPELLLGDLPDDLRGTVSVLRGEERLWQAEFLSGEANMSHTLANLEHHHFKYRLFRRPGDVHVHFIGAAVLSCTAGIETEPGDVFEIQAPRSAPVAQPARGRPRRGHGAGQDPNQTQAAPFGAPLRNPLPAAPGQDMVRVRALYRTQAAPFGAPLRNPLAAPRRGHGAAQDPSSLTHAAPFGAPLRNPLALASDEGMVRVRA